MNDKSTYQKDADAEFAAGQPLVEGSEQAGLVGDVVDHVCWAAEDGIL
jgi:hypothetical protein